MVGHRPPPKPGGVGKEPAKAPVAKKPAHGIGNARPLVSGPAGVKRTAAEPAAREIKAKKPRVEEKGKPVSRRVEAKVGAGAKRREPVSRRVEAEVGAGAKRREPASRRVEAKERAKPKAGEAKRARPPVDAREPVEADVRIRRISGAPAAVKAAEAQAPAGVQAAVPQTRSYTRYVFAGLSLAVVGAIIAAAIAFSGPKKTVDWAAKPPRIELVAPSPVLPAQGNATTIVLDGDPSASGAAGVPDGGTALGTASASPDAGVGASAASRSPDGGAPVDGGAPAAKTVQGTSDGGEALPANQLELAPLEQVIDPEELEIKGGAKKSVEVIRPAEKTSRDRSKIIEPKPSRPGKKLHRPPSDLRPPPSDAKPRHALASGAPAQDKGRGAGASARPVAQPVPIVVSVEEFGDFECPPCKRAFEVIDGLKRKFGSRISFWFRHFPLGKACNSDVAANAKRYQLLGVPDWDFHRHACKAAEAAECAREQGKFDDFAAVLYAHQDQLAEGFLTRAQASRLSLSAFDSCMSSGRTKARVERNVAEGISRGVKGTPAIFVDGERFTGDFADLPVLVERKLGGSP